MNNNCKGGIEILNGNTAVALDKDSKERKKKFTGGNASKRHRDRVNIEFNNLAKLLPFPKSVIAKLDKSSILRLAVSYIRAKSFFKDIESVFENEFPGKEKPVSNGEKFLREGSGLVSELFSKALDGFLLVLTEDMKVLFVSEPVRDYLGYCQAGIIHENFLQFVNPTDEHVIKASMLYKKGELDEKELVISPRANMFNESSSLLSDDFLRNIDSRGRVQAMVQRNFSCRMKCAFSCSSRFYTAYRTFQFSGHLSRSKIQEGREEKQLNTLVVFGTPLMTTNGSVHTPADQIQDEKLRVAPHDNEDLSILEKVHTGFRIEPTLRPHISPIPVTNHEVARRTSTSCVGAQASKPRHSPSRMLSESYQRQPYFVSHNMTTYGHRESTYTDSRYSDHSDDSKNSPISSPNLLWKQNRPLSPHFRNKKDQKYELPQPKQYLYVDEQIERRQAIAEYRLLQERLSPDPYIVYKNNTNNRSHDVYVGAHMLMNLKSHEQSLPPDLLFKPRIHIKRNNNSFEHEEISRKRVKSNKTNSFNINYLLGIDEQQTSTSSEQYVDVCSTADDVNRNAPFRDIIHNMSKNLDDTFRKTMSSLH